ncbi:MAG TPA: MFS transporter [Actinocrinis sp.]|nr:MFS transporter [Actinocrinis sp.]
MTATTTPTPASPSPSYTPTDSHAHTPRTALRSPAFRRLWVAGLITDTGDWMLMVAMPLLVYQATGSALGTAAAFLIELAPQVLLAAPAGHLADRLDRRKLLVAVGLTQALALTPLLLPGAARLPLIYTVIATQAALAAVFEPTKNALLPTLVAPDLLVSANALVGLNQNLGRLVGGALGGLLLAAGNLHAIAACDAATFLASALLIARTHTSTSTPAPTPTTHPSSPPSPPTAPTSAPFPFPLPPSATLLSRRPIRAALAVALLTAVSQGLFIVLFVIFVTQALHGDAAENGLLRAVQAIGSIGGGLILARTRGPSPGRLTGIAALSFGLLALLTWNLPRATIAEPAYIALFIIVGAPGLAMLTGLTSALQQATADGERGRAFAAFGAVYAAGQAIGMVTAGLSANRISIITLLDIQAAFYLLAGLVALVLLRPDP